MTYRKVCRPSLEAEWFVLISSMAERVYLAHSARPDRGIPAQEYGEHVRASRDLARQYAEECGRYSPLYGEMLVAAAMLAGEFHDLGKLDDANQKVLAGTSSGKLPVPHVDAGAAHLLQGGNQASKYAALVCYAIIAACLVFQRNLTGHKTGCGTCR